MNLELAYTDEQDIVDDVRQVADDKVCFWPAESDLAHRFLDSLRGGNLTQRERPDFEDLTDTLLIEAMRVDDHPRPGKKYKTRQRESDALAEINKLGLKVNEDAKVVAAVSSGLPTEQDHNYQAYLKHFSETVGKHARNEVVYRAERPGFDLGFLIFDESTAHFEGLGSFGPPTAGRPHFWFTDEAFVQVMLSAGVDCIMWWTPYKRMNDIEIGEIPLPKLTIIDLELLGRETHEVYDARRMISTEK